MSSSRDTKPTFLFPAAKYENSNRVPKSPKSPKVIAVENPLLKRPQFLLGSTQMASTTMRSEGGTQNLPRSPLTSLSINRPKHTNKTPGPPPKASLSLMSMSVAPPTKAHDSAIVSGSRQAGFIDSHGDTPITPPPMNSSPQLLQQSQVEIMIKSTSDFASGDSGNWIVAYGYASREEYKELERILMSYGSIINSQANANWFAIKYESQLAAEKALCGQPIKLSSNSLCGTVRGSPQLLQTLRAQQPNQSLKSADYALNFAFGKGKASTADAEPTVLSEQDILARSFSHDGYNRDWRHSDSICEKIFAWFFGWDRAVSQKLHTN